MRRMRAICVCLLLSVVPAFSGDDWQKKDFSAWNKDEVFQVLQDSPWVRRVAITPPGAPELRGPGIAETSSQTGFTDDQVENATIARRGFKPLNAIPDQIPKKVETLPVRPVLTAYLKVRWHSSRTIREAVARYWELQGVASPEAAKRLVSYQPEQYAIGLGPVSVTAPTKEQGEEALKRVLKRIGDSASLIVDAGKPLAPMAVEVPHGISLTPAAGISLYFPLQLAGQPLIPPDAKKARFRCEYELGGRVIQVDVEFDLAKMKRDSKPDL